MGLLAVLEDRATRAYPVLSLDEKGRKLIAKLEGDEFQERQKEQNVRFDGLLILRAGERGLQNIRELPSERGVFGSA